MNLVIDYGNSGAKVGIFDQQNLVERTAFPSSDELRKYLQQTKAQYAIISSVNENAADMASWLPAGLKSFILDPSLPLPVKNRYATPSTLGVDRLAGVCGAQEMFPNNHCLVIDAGTCITYDIIDRDRNYLGGGISPGLSMRFKAVHTFTTKLPLVSPAEHVKLIGDSTETCIQSGVVNGILAEMEGIIQQYQAKFEGLKVILCGGDARFFENQLKASIFAIPELVLFGLNSILIYNVNR